MGSALDALLGDAGLPPARGRRAATNVSASYERDLTEADVQALRDLPEGGLGAITSPLRKLRFQHHTLARLLAEGKSQVEAALVTGYSESYISIIKNDPAFKSLVTYYQEQVQEVFVSVHERLAALGMNTIEELQERLAETPDSFTNRELMELSELTLDRTGYGPTSKHQVNDTGLPQELVERLKHELATRSKGQVRSLPQGNPRLEGGGPVIEGTLAPAQAPEGSEGEGSDV
jgi:hypothetical protein